MSEDTENTPTSPKPAPTSTATSSVLTSLTAWLKKWWGLMLGSLAGLLALLAAVAWSSRKNGRSEVLVEQLQKTLDTVEQTKEKLSKLNQQKIDLVTEIAKVQADRTKALEEDLTDAEVLKRLKEKGIIKP